MKNKTQRNRSTQASVNRTRAETHYMWISRHCTRCGRTTSHKKYIDGTCNCGACGQEN